MATINNRHASCGKRGIRTFPLALRITKDRKISFIHLGYHLSEKDWDADEQRVCRSHPNSARLNNFIRKKLAEASDVTLELDTQQEGVSDPKHFPFGKEEKIRIKLPETQKLA